jgi:hypothetical protein
MSPRSLPVQALHCAQRATRQRTPAPGFGPRPRPSFAPDRFCRLHSSTKIPHPAHGLHRAHGMSEDEIVAYLVAWALHIRDEGNDKQADILDEAAKTITTLRAALDGAYQ